MLYLKNNIAYNHTVIKQRKEIMPTKKTKKVATKSVAKKPVKRTVKPAVAPKPVAEIQLPDPYCHCTKRKRNMILTCTVITSFLLGFFTYHLFFCPHHPHFKQRIQFENGCVNVETVKCPKLLEQLPAIDADHDGCVTKAELRASKKHMRRHHKPMPEQPVEAAPVAE